MQQIIISIKQWYEGLSDNKQVMIDGALTTWISITIITTIVSATIFVLFTFIKFAWWKLPIVAIIITATGATISYLEDGDY